MYDNENNINNNEDYIFENNVSTSESKEEQAYESQTANTYFDYITHPVEVSPLDEPKKKKAKKDKKEKKPAGFGKKLITAIALGACFGVFAGLGFYGVNTLTGANNSVVQTQPTVTTDTTTIPSVQQIPNEANATTNQITYVHDDITDMVADVMPAMVSIINNYVTTEYSFFGQGYTTEKQASGSGIIVGETDTELLIATNNHVIEDAKSLEVTFIDGSTAAAVIKGTDPDMDLAVIAVKIADLTGETKANITIATLGDSDSLRLGEPVVAIGNALGYGQSVTDGIVSALDRELETESGTVGTFIQTNAAINPGNSGGALLNLKGEVIGINSNKIGGTTIEGMGYAIPISAASPILSELMTRTTRTEIVDAAEMGYMGVTMQAITDDIANAYGIPKGVYVTAVEENSPAAQAGIRKGDVIVKFDGQKISSTTDVKNTIQYYRAGETTTITVKRAIDGEYTAIDIEITFGKKPQQ